MRSRIAAGLLAIAVAVPAAVPATAVAQRYGDRDRGDYRHDREDGRHRGPGERGDYRWNGDRNAGWDPARHFHDDRGYRERRLGRGDRIYRGGDGRYYCRRNDGTTGLVIGALGGGLLGGVIGGNTLGALLGAGGGALLGRSVDRGQVRCR